MTVTRAARELWHTGLSLSPRYKDSNYVLPVKSLTYAANYATPNVAISQSCSSVIPADDKSFQVKGFLPRPGLRLPSTN